jgi:hypothetical protein
MGDAFDEAMAEVFAAERGVAGPAEIERNRIRQQGALAERKRIIALLRERLGEDDDASAACLRISDLADELEAQP